MYSIGLDIGTTGVKAMVCDLAGNVHGSGFCEYGVVCSAPGLAEQDAEYIWQRTMQALAGAVAACGDKSRITTLSLSVQGDAVIPVDAALRPLHPALLGMDYRTTGQAAFFTRRFGDREIFTATGMRPHPMNSATKILWFLQNKPEVAGAVYKYMTYADFILAKLGSDGPVIDHTMASRTMAFSLDAMDWDNGILSAMGLERDRLSTPVSSGTAVGTLSSALAQQLGLPGPVTLVAGGHDQTCAALGAGVVKEHIAVDSHGTAEVISTAFAGRQAQAKLFDGYYPCYCHAKAGMYFTFSLNHTGGILLKWFRDNFCEEELRLAEKSDGNAYRLMEKAAGAGPSPVLVLPHFNGSGTPTCDIGSKGAFVGLTMSTTKGDITKGIMDSLAYELRINLEQLRAAGVDIASLRAVGGGASSPLWLQIKADVTGCAVATLKVREAACLGAALLGFAGTGACTLDEAVAGAVRLGRVYEPDAASAALYEEKYALYRALYPALRDINHRL